MSTKETTAVAKVYKDIDAVVADFSKRGTAILADMLRYAWDLGAQFKQITDEKKYGDKAQEILSEKLAIGKSTLYAYKKFNEAYPSTMIQEFADAGIPWRSIYKVISTDEKHQHLLEEKLLSGEIDPQEGLENELKKIKQEEEDEKLMEDGSSVSEQQAVREAPEASVKASREIKKPLYKITKLSEMLETAIHDSESAFQDMDMISDDNLYSSVQDVIQSNVDTLDALFKVAEHWKERANVYAPSAPPEAPATPPVAK